MRNAQHDAASLHLPSLIQSSASFRGVLFAKAQSSLKSRRVGIAQRNTTWRDNLCRAVPTLPARFQSSLKSMLYGPLAGTSAFSFQEPFLVGEPAAAVAEPGFGARLLAATTGPGRRPLRSG